MLGSSAFSCSPAAASSVAASSAAASSAAASSVAASSVAASSAAASSAAASSAAASSVAASSAAAPPPTLGATTTIDDADTPTMPQQAQSPPPPPPQRQHHHSSPSTDVSRLLQIQPQQLLRSAAVGAAVSPLSPRRRPSPLNPYKRQCSATPDAALPLPPTGNSALPQRTMPSSHAPLLTGPTPVSTRHNRHPHHHHEQQQDHGHHAYAHAHQRSHYPKYKTLDPARFRKHLATKAFIKNGITSLAQLRERAVHHHAMKGPSVTSTLASATSPSRRGATVALSRLHAVACSAVDGRRVVNGLVEADSCNVDPRASDDDGDSNIDMEMEIVDDDDDGNTIFVETSTESTHTINVTMNDETVASSSPKRSRTPSPQRSNDHDERSLAGSTSSIVPPPRTLPSQHTSQQPHHVQPASLPATVYLAHPARRVLPVVRRLFGHAGPLVPQSSGGYYSLALANAGESEDQDGKTDDGKSASVDLDDEKSGSTVDGNILSYSCPVSDDMQRLSLAQPNDAT